MALLISKKIAHQFLVDHLIRLQLRSKKIFISCNFRLLKNLPKLQDKITIGILNLVPVTLPNPEAIVNANEQCLAVTQNLAERLFLPLIKVKRSRLHPQILRSNLAVHHTAVLLIIDVIWNARSLVRLINKFKKQNINVQGILAFFAFPSVPSEIKINHHYINLIQLVDYRTLLQEAKRLKIL